MYIAVVLVLLGTISGCFLYIRSLRAQNYVLEVQLRKERINAKNANLLIKKYTAISDKVDKQEVVNEKEDEIEISTGV